MFEYERESHIGYLQRLIKPGTIQDYIDETNELQDQVKRLKDLVNPDDKYIKDMIVCIDQCEGICWGDILMYLKNIDMISISSQKNAIKHCLKLLNEHGFESAQEDSIYYNKELNCFMCTIIASEIIPESDKKVVFYKNGRGDILS